MKRFVISVLALGLWAQGVSAAQIDLQNALDGSSKMTLDGYTGAYADMNIVVITAAVDTVNVCFVNAFFDATDDHAIVGEATGGVPGWVYGHTNSELPSNLDDPGGNEYGLICGDSDGSAKLPLGNAAYIIRTLGMFTSEQSGSTDVTFELGLRAPQVFGPPPTYTMFSIAPPGSPVDLPNMLYIGDPSSNNTPFEINYIPEPSAAAFAALAAASVLLRRRIIG